MGYTGADYQILYLGSLVVVNKWLTVEENR